MEVKTDKTDGKRTIDRKHEEDFYMDATELAGFLRNLADEVEEGHDIEIETEEWTLPFSFNRNQVEVEIDFEGDELEIELEFEKREGSKGLSV